MDRRHRTLSYRSASSLTFQGSILDGLDGPWGVGHGGPDSNDFTSARCRLFQTSSVSNFVADYRIHYTDTIGISRAVLITVDERGEITPVVSLTLPERTLFTHCHGQERLVCFRTRHVEDPEYCFITVVHLDYPTTNLRMDIPDVVDLTVSRRNPDRLSKFHQLVQ